MKRFSGTWLLLGCAAGLLGASAALVGLARAADPQAIGWAYAVPPPSAAPDPPVLDDGKVFTLPDTTRTFTLNQIRGRRDNATPVRAAPADWYPDDHPVMPKIVAEGDNSRAIIACALCHYPNGKGRSENAPVAGLPKDYIAGQLHDMRTGVRNTAEPRKTNVGVMIAIAKGMTEDEIAASATYYAAMPWTPWIRVVEAATAPKVRSAAGLNLPLTGAEAGVEALGERIVETPENPERTDVLRDPRSGFVAYVPIGAVAKGRDLVKTGAGGKTVPCGICHGEDLSGVGTIPGISARSPSYIARQINDFQEGARHGTMAALMKPVVAKLTAEDILDVAAYLASEPAPKSVNKRP